MAYARIPTFSRAAAWREPRRAAVSLPWVNWPLFAVLLLIAAALVVSVPSEHVAGAILAYVNVLLIAGGGAYWAASGTIQGLIPALFLTWLAAAWPLAAIYFALQAPDLSYATLSGERQFLFENVRLQAVTGTFLLAYFGSMHLFRGAYARWRNPVGTAEMDRRAAMVALLLSMAAISLNAASKIKPLPGLLQYLADGAYQYLHGLPLVVGALFTRLSIGMRLMSVTFLLGAGAFYSVGNARGMAALPVALFLVGLIFLSDFPWRWKRWILIAALVCFPVALSLTNTTRVVTKTIGFQDLGARLDALGKWQQVLSDTPVLTSTFSRLYFTGGHTIVALSPEYYAYVPFSVRRYIAEFVMRMLPRRFFGELYYSEQPNRILRDYGFMITDETSVPLSLVGSLYMLGGYLPVAIGAAVIGLFHCLLSRGLQNARRRSPYMALFIFAMIGSEIVWGQNRDPISHVRSLIWDSMWAVALFCAVVRPLIGTLQPARATARRPQPLVWRAT